MEETTVTRSFALPAWVLPLGLTGLELLFILVVAAASGHFGSLLYTWALLPAAAALGFSVYGGLAGDAHAVRSGRRFLYLSLALFVVLALLVEILLFGLLGRLVLGNTVIPLILLVAGGVLVWRSRGRG